LSQASVLKKILEAIKELVTEANFDCTNAGIVLQAMDTSHVSLVGLFLRADGWDHFRCDRALSLGINLASMSKILKCAGNDDSLTLKAADEADSIQFLFESPKHDKISDFDLKLMEIESDALGIPETEYKAVVNMPSTELQRICRDLSVLGDTVKIAVTKEGVKFSVTGELGTGNITCRQGEGAVDDTEAVTIKLDEAVTLAFALRYLNFFTKATSLANDVTLSLSPDVPLMVEYKMEELGHIRFYLAPKIDED